jgi:hypothetical protein
VLRTVSISLAPRVLISREAVPYRPNRGVYVEVEELASGIAGTDERHGSYLDSLCAVAGVAGAWSFADDSRRITVSWLDAPPLEVNTRLAGVVSYRRAGSPHRTVFAGPLQTITPWEWDWFDGE